MNSPIEIVDLENYIGYIEDIATSEKSHLYRGQEDAEWQVRSSAFRRLEERYRASPHSFSYVYLDYLSKIIYEVKLNYPSTYRNLFPLECMAHLQHNGVATGLIDFTFNPLVALWFACAYEKQNTNGKVIVLENDRDIIEQIETPEKLESDLETFFGVDEAKWHLWSPALDSQFVDTQRMTRQHSVFLFGLPEVASEMVATEIVIPYVHKKQLRAELAKVGISEQTLFADLLGFFDRNTPQHAYDSFLSEPNTGGNLP